RDSRSSVGADRRARARDRGSTEIAFDTICRPPGRKRTAYSCVAAARPDVRSPAEQPTLRKTVGFGDALIAAGFRRFTLLAEVKHLFSAGPFLDQFGCGYGVKRNHHPIRAFRNHRPMPDILRN